MKVLGFVILTAAVFLTVVLASEGDERPEFIACVENCASTAQCNLTPILRLSGWSCLADCKYQCMRADVKSSLENGLKMVQYYGKWPFIRILGAQELFSVLFSLGNLFACLYGYFYIYKRYNRRVGWMGRVHWIGLWITCNTWLQSAIFHYRDTPVTEKLDYFSACLCILSSVPVVLIRLLEIKKGRDQIVKVVLPMTVVYLQHVAYMSFVLFDYGYNVKFNAVFGVLSNVLWLYWSSSQSERIRNETIKFVGANVLTMLLVAIDFPPFFELIDMHALWHLSTIPVTLMWYKFMRTIELEEEKEKEYRKKK